MPGIDIGLFPVQYLFPFQDDDPFSPQGDVKKVHVIVKK